MCVGVAETGARVALVALRRARKPNFGVFFLIAFSFAPDFAKEKANGDLIFPLAVDGTWGHGRGEHRSPAKKHKETFLLSYFCVTKSTKSHQRERSPLFENSSRVHELVARAMRGKCMRQRGKGKIGSFTALRNLNYTTRANISHEIAEQIRARIVSTPAYKGAAGVTPVHALTKARIFASLLQWEKVAREA